MRLLLLALLSAGLMAGCTESPNAVPEDPTLIAVIVDDGDLPVQYDLRVREYQADAALGDQSGPVLWSIRGQVEPGRSETIVRELDGRSAYWVEILVERAILGGGSGIEFHLDPADCDDVFQVTYTDVNSLMAMGGSSEILACGKVVG